MSNEPTDAELEAVEVSGNTIRQAIIDRIPAEPHIIRDVQVHSGVAKISIRWGMLCWSTSMAMQDMTVDEIADKVEVGFKEWVAQTVKNMKDTNRYSQPVEQMAVWLRKAA